MRFFIVNQASDASITRDVLLQIAAALSTQVMRDFAPAWGGETAASISVADKNDGLPADAVVILIQDALDAQGALGYHDVEGGRPVVRIGWNAIQANGGTLTSSPNSLSATLSHEAVEALGDDSASAWQDLDSTTEVAYEVGDPVEGDGYPVDVPAVGALPAGHVFVSNFVLPSWFVAGSAGPWDKMGKLSAPLSRDPGGYWITRVGGPGGQTQDSFAKTPEEGGMPLWLREEKQKKARHNRRHHKGEMITDCLSAPGEGIADEALDAIIEADERALDDVALLALMFLAASHDPGGQFGTA